MPIPTNKPASAETGWGRPSPQSVDGQPSLKGIFAPQYFGSVYYYAALAACEEAVVDTGLRYDKRFKSIHRCTVADTRGPLTLTVPVSKPPSGGLSPEGATVLGALAPRVEPLRQWRQMTVSSHGQWWADHRVSLESGYGRTPYFEFYIDRFLPWLSNRHDSVVDFDSTLDQVIRRTLGITTDVKYVDLSSSGLDLSGYTDYRNNRFEGLVDVPYWQVRADRLGFLPGLSILDLMFNMGPESIFVLHRMSGR